MLESHNYSFKSTVITLLEIENRNVLNRDGSLKAQLI